jgi:hypothetical protein
MEENVKPKDEDGVDGWGVWGWDGWVCGLGPVGASSIFGLVRRAGAFTGDLLTLQLEAMVGGALARASTLRVGLGVGRALIASGSRTRPSHSCDGWVCDLGVVGAAA